MDQIGQWLSSNAIALFALAVSALSLFLHFRRDSKAAKDAKRARLSTQLLENQVGFTLLVVNTGSGHARDIAVLLDGKPAGDHPAFRNDDHQKSTLGPNSSFGYMLIHTRGRKLPATVEITWKDDSGIPGRYETHL